jgi:hypothetical protein
MFFYILIFSGVIYYRKNKEKCENFKTGDVIRMEISVPQRIAVIFKNDKQLPFRFINIPMVTIFYVSKKKKKKKKIIL